MKFEFNTWGRDLALGTTAHRFVLSIPEELAVPGWSAGNIDIATPQLDEQAAFKVRALWERDKGRDLFDLWAALTHGDGNPETIATIFNENYRKEGFDPAKLVDNLHDRLNAGRFESDLKPFVRTWPPYTYQPAVALDLIRETIISRLE